jgi:hypothetical protein
MEEISLWFSLRYKEDQDAESKDTPGISEAGQTDRKREDKEGQSFSQPPPVFQDAERKEKIGAGRYRSPNRRKEN